jgi:hypothetical protein
MKRLLAATLIVASLATPAHAEGKGPCSGWFSNITHTMPMTKVVEHTKLTIACAVGLWPVPGGLSYALAIADRESHFDPEAYNPSGCAGVYQQMLRYWPGRVRAWFPRGWFWKVPRAFNMRANVIVSIRMVHAGGWGPWALP